MKIPPAGIAKGSHLDVEKRTSFPTEFSIFFRQMYSALKPGSADTQLLFSLISFLTHFPPKKTKSERSFQKVKFGLNLGKFDATPQLQLSGTAPKDVLENPTEVSHHSFFRNYHQCLPFITAVTWGLKHTTKMAAVLMFSIFLA